MRLDIITLFPEILNGFFAHSIIKRAIEKGHVQIMLHNLRDYSSNKYKSVDDYPFGGGAGMVMMIEPIARCIRKLKEERGYDEIIYLTPDGKLLDQPMANTLSMKDNMILLCGHYKGVDERVREFFVTQEISIGNYVLSGGELPAAILVDSIIRLIPGVLGNESSALFDSFQNQLLAPPVYTRPRNFEGMEVPPVLLSGNEKEIEEWRYTQSLERTRKRRPGYLE